MPTLRTLAGTCALVLAVAPAAALAQSQHFGDRTPSVQEIEQALSRPAEMEGEPGVKTRGLAVGAASKATAAAPAAPAPAPSISMQIRFDFDSDRIQPHSIPSLDNVARALQSDALRAKTFDIIGHTDATGSYGYNMNLSQRRANAVKSYLMSHGVEPTRLKTIGRGPTELFNRSQPDAAENRRVEIAVGG